jgi:hypothetical protein
MATNSAYYNNLIRVVLESSVRDNWQQAVLEWVIDDCEEDDTLEASCICGKENLRYLFTIRNALNGNILYPIGSTCIKKFDRSELNDEVTVREQLFKLLHAIEGNEFISLTSELFSRKLLAYLYDVGAFEENEYNGYDAEVDYLFLLKMFNKRDKDSISLAQRRKISAVILSSIKPFLQDALQDKIKNGGTKT